jgi:hypothetical protein
MSTQVVESKPWGGVGVDASPVKGEPPATRLGGYALVTMGALYILLLVYSLVTPAEQRYGAGAFLKYFFDDRVPLTVTWSMICMTSILGFVFVPAVYDLLNRHLPGGAMRLLFRAVTVYGLSGYAFLAVSLLTLFAKAPGLAKAYVNGSPATREAMEAFGLPELDPNGWIVFGGVATWVIVSTIIAVRAGLINKVVAGFGFLWGIGFWAPVFADATSFEPLNIFAATASAISAPVWGIALGRRLIKAAPSDTA